MTERPLGFALTFLGMFALSFVFLWAVDALPEPISTKPVDNTPTQQPVQTLPLEEPVRVVARDIGLDAAVVNPATTSVEILDQALEDGAVRYPTSAVLGEEGTMLLFGHSSYLPVVYHQYYKIFNGIQNLKVGQTVSVYSQGLDYRYTVREVYLANADEDVIELTQTGKHLVLITCNSFATKSARFVVKAEFEGAYAL